MAAPTAESAGLQVSLGAAFSLPTGQPVLAGPVLEQLFAATAPAGRAGGFVLHASDDWLLGAASVPGGDALEANTAQLYRELFAAVRGRYLARIWNYVPAINAPGPDGLENYRAFCRARSLAFEQEFGPANTAQMSAASAVGCDAPQLTVVFAASRRPPQHFENPEQIPAYEYPREYGPRPPSFARATVVPAADGTSDIFISGTAAIQGHASVRFGRIDREVWCTIGNLAAISRACGAENLGLPRSVRRCFKIYVRRAEDLPIVSAMLQGRLLHPGDEAIYIRADICRAELNVEIEASLFGVRA